MKKIASIIICIVFVFVLTISFAENSTTDDILFRKIPWGTSATNFLKLMKKEKLGGSIYEASYLKTWEMIDGKDDYLNSYEDLGFYYSAYPNKMSVAGVPVKSIYAGFIYTYNKNGVNKLEKQSSLYKASYTFEPADIGATYPILVDKMSSIYGQGKSVNGTTHYWSTGEKGDYTETIDTVVWQGANNTAVRLYMESKVYDNEQFGTDYVELKLEYGLSNSDSLFAKLIKAIAREQTKEMLNNNDTDGL